MLTLSKGTVTIAGGSDDSDKPGSESPRASPRRSFPDASSALKPSKSFTFDHVYDEYTQHAGGGVRAVRRAVHLLT